MRPVFHRRPWRTSRSASWRCCWSASRKSVSETPGGTFVLCSRQSRWSSTIAMKRASSRPPSSAKWPKPSSRSSACPSPRESTAWPRRVRARRAVYIDAERASGTSATDEELGHAVAKAADILAWLEARMPSAAIGVGHSGNGASIFVALSHLPERPELALSVKALLAGLDHRFSDVRAKVDRSVSDAKRLCPAFGTTKRKGAPGLAERTHRRTAFVCAVADKTGSFVCGWCILATKQFSALNAMRCGRPRATCVQAASRTTDPSWCATDDHGRRTRARSRFKRRFRTTSSIDRREVSRARSRQMAHPHAPPARHVPGAGVRFAAAARGASTNARTIAPRHTIAPRLDEL